MTLEQAIELGYSARTVEQAHRAIAALEPFLELDEDLVPLYPEAWSASEQAAMMLSANEAQRESEAEARSRRRS